MSVWRLAVWLSVFWVGFAWGQIYKWTDRQGNMYLTDDPSRIPAEYRSKVEVERASPPTPLAVPSDDAAPAPPTDATRPGNSQPTRLRGIGWDGAPTIGSSWPSNGLPGCRITSMSATGCS